MLSSLRSLRYLLPLCHLRAIQGASGAAPLLGPPMSPQMSRLPWVLPRVLTHGRSMLVGGKGLSSASRPGTEMPAQTKRWTNAGGARALQVAPRP